MVPSDDRLQLRDGQWTCGDGKEREKSAGVSAESTEFRRYVAGKVMLAATAGEDAKPERRPFCLRPQLGRSLCVELWGQLPDQLYAFIAFQRAEVQSRDSVRTQFFDQGVLPGRAGAGRPARCDDRQPFLLRFGRADQVGTKSQREVVDPLDIVHDQQDRSVQP